MAYILYREDHFIGQNYIPNSYVNTSGTTENDFQKCTSACDSNPDCVGFQRTEPSNKYECLLMKKGFTLTENLNHPLNPKIFVKGIVGEQNMQEKIDAVQNVPGSEFASQGERYQETMMSGVIWASIGTLVLFYVFNKMS